MMRTALIFAAGGVAGALALPYLKRASSKMLVSLIESVEKSQLELEHVEKIKAETEAARDEVQHLKNEAEQLRDEVRRLTSQRDSSSAS